MEERTRQIIKEVNTNMSLEGMPLTDEDKEVIRKCLEGESTFEKERKKLLNECKSLYG